MQPTSQTPATADEFELRFDPLRQHGRRLAFPCAGDGCVDLDALSERERCDYFYARTVIGRDFARPRLQRRAVAAVH